MSEIPFLSIIIPARNEENRLPQTLELMVAFLQVQAYPWELFVVENGSTDRTAEVAGAFSRDNPAIHVLREPVPGKGRAIRTGMLAASGQYRFMADADQSMPIDELPGFLPPVAEGFDIVIASREAPGAERFGEPEYRHLGGRLVNTLIRTLALPGLHDTQCGYKMFTAAAADALFSRQTLDGWSFDIEILYAARLQGFRILERPIPWHYRSDSKVNPVPDTLRMLADIFRIRKNAKKGRYG